MKEFRVYIPMVGTAQVVVDAEDEIDAVRAAKENMTANDLTELFFDEYDKDSVFVEEI